MKVLKFGGSSVATSENINKVINIVKDNVFKGQQAVVVSALGGVTDLLLKSGEMACSGNPDYKIQLNLIEERHLEVVRDLIPVSIQSGILGNVKKMLNKLESSLEGVYLINEISDKTSDKIVSYGEFLFQAVQATSMVKSFKAILLESFLRLNGFVNPPTLEMLAEDSKRVFERYPLLKKNELSEKLQQSEPYAVAWLTYWKNNPIKYSCTANTISVKYMI